MFCTVLVPHHRTGIEKNLFSVCRTSASGDAFPT